MEKQLAALLAILTLILFMPTNQVTAANKATDLDDIKFFIDTYYYGDIPKNLDKLGSIEEIIDALDEYSRYLTPEEYRTYLAANTNHKTPNIATTTTDAKPAVTSAILYGNIGYIKITTFSSSLRNEVEAHWAKLNKSGVTQLIIDLRYNGGGYVESAEQLLGFFPNVTDAYHIATRGGNKNIKPVQAKTKFPNQTYMLLNRYSASASEIVAVALQDQQAATLVGETTKGKGTVQAFFEFEDGGALKLTIGEFTGPKGTKVHKKGITPTIKTEPDKELSTIHQQLLTQSFNTKQYKKTDTLKNMPTDKTFHIQFTQPMNFTDPKTSSKVELIKHGGIAVPITIEENNDNTLDIIPTKNLQPGASYVLIIHPGLQNTKGRTTKQGTQTTITIKDW